ncbi:MULTISPECIES: hypothetical protein [unclassified Pseudomonas]|uniref:hypothetical protein n=1 Tax=unclassified Pseudomonas TaxID=196821 RepID=UPI00244787BF|nr:MULTISPECIES: hypothetical protein [unclassified Pseudomonas]MDG9927904.1 hypothetical protein [Pseudomonas sp. GD04042]MDH0481913.1 hypothetical protein [Pseudomonas sp. GD04015]MDH0606452.1 hypothetical protein [Pseudomonas sp. GD03869]
MRAVFALFMLLCSFAVSADDYARLYQSAGWPDQRAHFGDALKAAQQRYQASLPPAVFQALVHNSNRRFEPTGMDQRALATLRTELADPQPALQFFESALGRRIVAAETLATSREQLAAHANGLPAVEADATRRLLIRHLARELPATEAAAEVSLALAGVAADSLSSMVPGLFGGDQTQMLVQSQRERLMQQIEGDIDNTLLHVYRDLSDPELDEFVAFAQSPGGKAYYQAAVAALRAGLAASGQGGQPQGI